MKFYNRKDELAILNTLEKQSRSGGAMTVITGRRRVGKTALAMEFSQSRRLLYLFISRKSEQLLCEEFLQKIRESFTVPVVGEIVHFRDIFNLLLQLSQKEPFTLIIDEFQEFYTINPSVYSEVQDAWDRGRSKSRVNLIFIGSVYSLMTKIFMDSKEPLFNRADRILILRQFVVKTMHEILKDNGHDDMRTLFDYYMFTGGMPRYMDILVTNRAFTRQKILDFILQDNSPFIHEGKNLLIEEFGREYGTYFSLLELIARGKTARSEMESILEKDVGGYLDRLENEYSIVEKHRPINAKPNSRMQKYKIKDNFLNFWFRFIFRNRSVVETGNFQYVNDVIARDMNTYSGIMLERFFREIFAASGKYNIVGSYWEKGNANEIDLVAVNELKRKLVIAEVKMSKERASLDRLKVKASGMLDDFKGYDIDYLALSLEDAARFL